MAGTAPGKGRATLARARLRRRLRGVRLLSLDVDGVLTDGGLYYDERGRVSRRFHVQDGVGIQRAMAAGIAVAFVSAGATASIRHRAKALGVAHVLTGVADKRAAIAGLCRRLKIGLEAVAHVGDDLNDLPLLQAVGCPLTVPGAVPEVRRIACFVTRLGGGHGAVREVCDLLLAARGKG